MDRKPLAAPLLLAVLACSGAAWPLGADALPRGDPHPPPENVLVLADGWEAQSLPVPRLKFPASLAWRGDALLVLEIGRYPYANPYQGQDKGRLLELTFPPGGAPRVRELARGLADPIGLAVGPDGDVWLTQFGRVSRLASAALDAGGGTPVDVSWGYPSQTPDAVFLPVTGMNVVDNLDPVDGETTGPMGLAFAADGQLLVTTAGHGRPPDDDGVREVTGLDYDNPYSSALIAPTGGPLTVEQRVARGCRNCFDLAFAPPGSPHAGELFVTENVGAYRLRLFAGSNRSLLAGSTPTDQGVLDGVVAVDFATGRFRRVGTFLPDGVLLGSSPTGIAFAPPDFPAGPHGMFVTLFSGFVPPSDDRGQVVQVQPDMALGGAVGVPFVVGLDFPTDLAFGPDGALYVVEFYTGRLYRIRPAA